MNNELTHFLERLAPGAIGSLIALAWIDATWPRKISMLFSGIATSHYVSPWVSSKMDLDPYVSAFLIGLFGMSIVDGIFRAWGEMPLGEIIRDALRRRLGLPPK